MFQIPAVVEKITTRVDKTLKIDVATTRELQADEEARIFRLKQLEGWMVFSESEVQQNDIPNEPIDTAVGKKTTSQRLRSVLYVFWSKNTSKTIPFDDYYKKWAEKQIEIIKEKIED